MEERNALAQRLAPISAGYLRRLLRESGVELDPLVEGVRQDDLDSLERTLLALGDVYGKAESSGDAGLMRLCRKAVIESKDHARLSLRRGAAGKAEMIQWMLVWLENPPVFPLWVRLRRRVITESPQAPLE
ncbi:MAG: hypothetical protein JJE04_19360 [Acidobacteriia bacterium]|nr:hypothetical protein [Terriglobia bacterium]